MSLEETNLELRRLIWLDKFADATQENREIQDKLRGIINSLLTFDNCQSCEDFLKHQINDREEKIVLIVSGQLGQEIIENIHQLRQIISIFVFCGNKQRNELWAKNYPKIRDVIVEVETLLRQIEIDQKSVEHRINQSIEIFTDDNQIIELLLQIPSDLPNKRDFLNICLKYYRNNTKEIENIEEFEHLYSSSDALNYLSDQKFVYRLLIKALLTMNVEMLFLLRFYLQDIDEQLKLSPNSSSKLYFGQLMRIDQIDKLNHFNSETIFRFNSFIRANENQEEIFNSLQNSSNTDDLHKVLFEIDPNEVAKICKDLILFPLNTYFRFISIKFEKRIWFVKLNISDLNKKSTENVNINPIQLAHYCRNLGLFDQSEKLFDLLLNEYPNLNSQCYDGLGRVAQDKGLYEESLQFYFKSLQTVSSEDRFHCLNNIGCAYDYLKQYENALNFFSQSFKLTKSDQHKAMCVNNIAITLAKTKQYDKALTYLKDSLIKQKNLFPENDYHIAISYSNLATIYSAIEQFDEALEYFHLALKSFQEKKFHFFEAIVFQNIAQICQKNNQSHQALQFYQHSFDILISLKPINHPNLIFIQQQIQLLKRST